MIFFLGLVTWIVVGFCIVTVRFALQGDVKLRDLPIMLALGSVWPVVLLMELIDVIESHGDVTIIRKIGKDKSTDATGGDHGPPR